MVVYEMQDDHGSGSASALVASHQSPVANTPRSKIKTTETTDHWWSAIPDPKWDAIRNHSEKPRRFKKSSSNNQRTDKVTAAGPRTQQQCRTLSLSLLLRSYGVVFFHTIRSEWLLRTPRSIKELVVFLSLLAVCLVIAFWKGALFAWKSIHSWSE